MKDNKISEIMEFKQKKVITKVVEKFPYVWKDNQLKTMQKIIENTPRIRLEDEVIRYSILNEKNIVKNKNFIKEFFNFQYYHNIPELMKVCDYTYLDFQNNENILDAYNKDASFNGFNFTKDSLIQSIEDNNSYAPFYAYFNKSPGKILICGGRHRMQVLKNKILNKVFLCIFWDKMSQNIECNLWIPTILIEKSLFQLELQVIKNNQNFSKIFITDATDLWLVLRAIDKEISYLIDFYPDLLKELNIIPPEGIMWKNKLDFS